MAAQFAERILLGFLAIYPTQTVGTPRAHFICSVLLWRHGRPGHHSPQAWLHRSLLRVGWDSRVPEPRSQRNVRAPRLKGFEETNKKLAPATETASKMLALSQKTGIFFPSKLKVAAPRLSEKGSYQGTDLQKTTCLRKFRPATRR